MDEELYGQVPVVPPAPVAPAKRSAGGRLVREAGETVLLALVIFLGVRMVVLPYQVQGASMTPNLDNRERLLVNRLAYAHFDLNRWLDLLPFVSLDSAHQFYPFNPPHRGDIIVFNPPTKSDEPYVKRVIGLPGESVTFKGGYVYINGQKLDEPYINGPITNCTESSNCDLGPIPPGYVFVLGDNRLNSSDSRYFGLVPMSSIIGKAVFANWPIKDFGPLSAPDYQG